MTELIKVHGSQNCFFILDQTELTTPLSKKELSALGVQLCDPQSGILGGADGLLVVDKGTHEQVAGRMQVVNADGSFASMCGNGLRTVSRYLAEKLGRDHFVVQTQDADLHVRKHADFAAGVPAYAVEISPVRFNREAMPLDNVGHERLLDDYVPEFAPAMKFSAIAVPNPHLISFMDEATLTGPLLGQLGKWLNGNNPYFSDGVNVNFAQILGDNQLFVRTYERGVGFTNACGTGMSATSLAFVLTHPEHAQMDQTITVYNPGGMVKTIVHRDLDRYWIELIGNATFTHHITVNEGDLHQANVEPDRVKIQVTDEQAAYQQFVQSMPKINSLQVR
ncbi:diaminopimelate epimerase [Limosilactobacillus difficilis]|uniref:diaminopimelate epimerase n=1 Tax=Limosilactobacillus difficilis TaxID=2991838 RepID=UPI0024B8D8BD|nr:diaminopimelate epimerase [Limosilactobacillus difficilis]